MRTSAIQFAMPTCEHFATELIRSLMAEPHLSSIRGSKDILFYSLHQLPSSFGCSDNVPAYTMPHGDRSKKRHDPILYDLSSVYHSQAPFTIQLIRSLLGEPHFSNVFATIDSMTENFLLLSPTYAGLSANSVAPMGAAVTLPKRAGVCPAIWHTHANFRKSTHR